MSRIGRVLMFIAASVVSGLALAFIIVAWRPQLVGVAAGRPRRPAAQHRAGRATPRDSNSPGARGMVQPPRTRHSADRRRPAARDPVSRATMPGRTRTRSSAPGRRWSTSIPPGP